MTHFERAGLGVGEVMPRKRKKRFDMTERGRKPNDGLCVDGSCINGNPGIIESQVTLIDGTFLKKVSPGRGTNNLAELIAIRLGYEILLLGKTGITSIWTDSACCIYWIRRGHCGDRPQHNAELKRIQEAQSKLKHVQLRKWNTKRWGEIPADFGRK